MVTKDSSALTKLLQFTKYTLRCPFIIPYLLEIISTKFSTMGGSTPEGIWPISTNIILNSIKIEKLKIKYAWFLFKKYLIFDLF